MADKPQSSRSNLPLISRNEALERLHDYQKMSVSDPEGAHICADSVLLDIVDDAEISAAFKAVFRGYGPNPVRRPTDGSNKR